MGSYKEIKGDLLELHSKGMFDIIGHGANCRSTMGAGIAAQIKEKYPDAYYADLYDPRNSVERFGSFSVGSKSEVYNLYTQYNPGACADLIAIRMSLKQLALHLGKYYFTIGLPQIGCGIGGLKWEDVRPIIQEELEYYDTTVVIYNKQ